MEGVALLPTWNNRMMEVAEPFPFVYEDFMTSWVSCRRRRLCRDFPSVKLLITVLPTFILSRAERACK